MVAPRHRDSNCRLGNWGGGVGARLIGLGCAVMSRSIPKRLGPSPARDARLPHSRSHERGTDATPASTNRRVPRGCAWCSCYLEPQESNAACPLLSQCARRGTMRRVMFHEYFTGDSAASSGSAFRLDGGRKPTARPAVRDLDRRSRVLPGWRARQLERARRRRGEKHDTERNDPSSRHEERAVSPGWQEGERDAAVLGSAPRKAHRRQGPENQVKRNPDPILFLKRKASACCWLTVGG